jgi:hypothetical protein
LASDFSENRVDGGWSVKLVETKADREQKHSSTRLERDSGTLQKVAGLFWILPRKSHFWVASIIYRTIDDMKLKYMMAGSRKPAAQVSHRIQSGATDLG